MPRTKKKAARAWGYWSEQKLSMLADYLPAFTRASSNKAPKTLYLDLFAGGDRNLSRRTGEEISGSPRVALDTVPRFSKVVLFELQNQADRLRAALELDYPERDLQVVPGDCNETVGPVLKSLIAGDWNWSPTFALIDQQAAEIRWTTLEQLSTFKHQRCRYKTELWMLFAPSMLPRALAIEDHTAVERFAQRVTAMYGTDCWRLAYEDRRRDVLTAAELRAELLNLMRWRLEKVLGYNVTHSFEMKNTKGVPLYNMVFATDNSTGEKIMKHVYGKAAEKRPLMQAEAAARVQEEKEQEIGAPGLFPPMPRAIKPDQLYSHQPPTPPYGSASN